MAHEWTVVVRDRPEDNVFIFPHGTDRYALTDLYDGRLVLTEQDFPGVMHGSIDEVVERIHKASTVVERCGYPLHPMLTVERPQRVNSVFYADDYSD